MNLESVEIEGLPDDNWEKTTYDQYGRTYQVFDAARNADVYYGVPSAVRLF